MSSETRITGPYLETKGSQSRPHCVTLFEPGRASEIHRFRTREEAQTFADTQRAAQESSSEE